MLRAAMPEWRWRYIVKSDSLALEIAPNELFITAYKSKVLTVSSDFQQPITLEQTEQYYDIAEIVANCIPDLPEPAQFHIVIHALAARSFHKTIANKSWLFKTNNSLLPLTPLVSIKSQNQQAIALMLEKSNAFATIMLLSENLDVGENKIFERYHLIKTSIGTLSGVVGQEALKLIS